MPSETLIPAASMSASVDTLSVGVIGLGVGRAHLEALRSYDRSRVVAACDLAQVKREELARRYNDIRVVRNANSILADPDINLVCIASYDDDHAQQVIAALQHGKHVFVEKPVCVTIDEARGIRTELASRPHLHLSSNLILRRCPRFIRLREMIESGELGTLFHIHAAYDYGRLEKLTDGWRGMMHNYSVMLGGGVHLVDLMMWLTEQRIERVCAAGNGIASADRFDGDDLVSAILQFEHGLVATLTANFGCVRPHVHELTISGTRGTFVNDMPHAKLFESRDPSAMQKTINDAYPGADKGELLPRFVDAILDGTPSEITVDEVFASLSVCLAIDESMRTGTWKTVEYC